MKTLLLPHCFRLPGWMLFIIGLAAGIMVYFDPWMVSGVLETVVYDVIIIGISMGGLFIVCSRERREDEMTGAIRTAALLNSFYIYIGLLVTYTLAINGPSYIYFMIANLGLFPIIFVILFRLEIHHNNKLSRNEESH